MDFLHHVQGIVVLNELGARVFAKYYSTPDEQARGILSTLEKQRSLEMSIHTAAHDPKRGYATSAEGDIWTHEGHTILMQVFEDVTFVVIGDVSENELVLYSVLRALVDALRQELKILDLNLRLLLEKYDALVLTVDELVDEGIILETNPANIATDVAPFIAVSGAETASKTLSKFNKYLKENL